MSNEKLISAKDLLNAVRDDPGINGANFRKLKQHIEDAQDAVEVVHGRWKKQVENGMYWYVCSECEEEVPKTRYKHDWYSNYCPNCGAKMGGGNEDV